MKITNKLDLPQAFVEMAQRDEAFGGNVYRVTSLLKGIRETILERRYADQIEEDVSDMIWLLFGSAVHSILERQQEADNELKEERLNIHIGNYILSGQFDLYNAEHKMITDYKTASVWKIIYQNYEDWRRQTLIYAYMMRQYGFPVERGQIVALLKDHSKREAKVKANHSYPPLPVHKVCFSFSERDFIKIEEWLHERFEEIAQAEKLPDNQLPVCTPDERFNSGDKYAVMKRGRKTAMRVLDGLEEAQAWMKANGGDHIEVRAGEDRKCPEYCSVNCFCDYYNQELKRGLG